MFKKLGYYLFILSTTSRLFPYLLIIGTTSMVVLIGMNAYFFGLFSVEALKAEGVDNVFGGGFVDALWWSFKHLLDPGAFSENYGAPLYVILFALFNSVMGLIITGALIGFIVSAIQTAMDNARVGAATVRERGHYLILGWNRKGAAILTLLAKLRVQERIVILTEHNLDALRTDLRQNARELRGLRVLPVQGAIGSSSELRRVASKYASHVLILAESQTGAQSDLTTIKALTLLTAAQEEQTQGTQLVAEIVSKDNVGIAQVASKYAHPIVSSSDFISKTMAQCARYPGYSAIYSELFASGDFVIDLFASPELEGVLFSEVATALNHAVVLGISWHQERGGKFRRVSVLNPEPDYDLGDGDELIILRRQDQIPELLMDEKVQILEQTRALNLERPNLSEVLIIVGNQNLGLMVRELLNHAAAELRVVVACKNASSEQKAFVQRFDSIDAARLNIEFVEFDLVESSGLERLTPQEFDVIFVSADESEAYIDADSRTMLILFLLQELKHRLGLEKFPPVVAELLNAESRDLCLETPMTDAVVSTELLSIQLAQLVRDPYLETLYNELLNAGGIEIGIRNISHYVEPGDRVSAGVLTQKALEFNETVLGFRRESGTIILSPDKQQSEHFEAGDQVIVLAQQVYL
ncbi:MAG: hypothetical protein VW684_10650 [Betaproteobacteria bacterium]